MILIVFHWKICFIQRLGISSIAGKLFWVDFAAIYSCLSTLACVFGLIHQSTAPAWKRLDQKLHHLRHLRHSNHLVHHLMRSLKLKCKIIAQNGFQMICVLCMCYTFISKFLGFIHTLSQFFEIYVKIIFFGRLQEIGNRLWLLFCSNENTKVTSQ